MATPDAHSTERIREFVIAAHGDLPRVKEMLAEHPSLLNTSYQWAENDSESAIQAAAQVGRAQVAEYLLERGAPLDVCTAAMLGRKDDVQSMLDANPQLLQARGAHGISLLAHAALSNNVELARMLFSRGAREGLSYALGNAVMKGHLEMARWLIEDAGADLAWKNYEGKSLLAIAAQSRDQALISLLREHGAPG